MGEEQLLVEEEFALLRTCLSAIPDPRQRWGRVHSLEGVLSLSVLCLMDNRRSLSGIRRFGELHPEALQGVEAPAQPFRAHSGKGALPSGVEIVADYSAKENAMVKV